MEVIETLFLALAYVAVVGFLVSGLDDLFFDTQFLVYLFRHRKRPHVSLQDLKLAPEQWVAILVPAWQEGGVVNQMAEFATRVALYEKYDIFIGVYPNDPETSRCVDVLCARHPRLHKVQVPHAGPTSKADCLNWLYRGMRANEERGRREYQVVAIHDAEDVLHPLVLKVYNHFIPREYDMGQVPVFALELPVWRYWTGNTYIDDFAELHTKDLFVRESIGGVVPSAGVGTAFSRTALDKLAAENGGDPFYLGNLTEDYEVGIRIKRAGYRAGFISVPVERIVRRKRRDGTLGPPRTITEVVAIRECFPTTIRAALRQRSRWILGISFQTWEQAGWQGNLPMRYTLLRDRRAPLTHLINMVGYLVLAYVAAQWLFRLTPWAQQLYVRPLFLADSLLWKLTIVDSCLLLYRAAQKFISVQHIYNVKQAAWSLPRTVLGNLINFLATVRAAKQYAGHKLFGRPIVWLKTAHTFPAEEELAEYTGSIEDLLVEDGLVTREQIFEALRTAQAGSAPLCLLRLGLLDEKDFTKVWAKFSRLGIRFIDPARVPRAALRRLPEARSLELNALPVEAGDEGLAMAFLEPPSAGQLEQASREVGGPVAPVLARPSNLAFARTRAYPRLVLPASRLETAMERFRQASGLEPAAFLETLSSRHPAWLTLPDLLVDLGRLPEPDARRLWAEALGLPPLNLRDFAPHQELYFRIGPSFWWLHRLLPITPMTVASAQPVHPRLAAWLTERMGAKPNFVAELPARLEMAARNHGADLDPDQVLLDCLAAKGVLSTEELARVEASRELVADPLPRWLLLQRRVTVEQLHQVFLETCYLPPAEAWQPEEVRRLSGVLPPGFGEEHGCYCLEESGGALRLGLTQMPARRALAELYDRLAGYPLCFQALSHEAAGQLRRAAG